MNMKELGRTIDLKSLWSLQKLGLMEESHFFILGKAKGLISNLSAGIDIFPQGSPSLFICCKHSSFQI